MYNVYFLGVRTEFSLVTVKILQTEIRLKYFLILNYNIQLTVKKILIINKKKLQFHTQIRVQRSTFSSATRHRRRHHARAVLNQCASHVTQP